MSEYIVDFGSLAMLSRVVESESNRLSEPVVRCRDCDHGLFGGKTCDRLDPGFDEYWFEVEPDGFCAWAERRTNDN